MNKLFNHRDAIGIGARLMTAGGLAACFEAGTRPSTMSQLNHGYMLLFEFDNPCWNRGMIVKIQGNRISKKEQLSCSKIYR